MPQPVEPTPDRPALVSRPSEPIFNMPAIVLGAIALCVGLELLRAYGLDGRQEVAFIVRTAFIPWRYSGGFDLDAYAFTSPLTYSVLHGGIAHLVVNMVWLAAFGSPLANRLGAWRFMSFWAVTAIAAAALHFAIYPLDDAPLVGASGAISGMMGAAARFGFRIDRSSRKPAFAGPLWPYRAVFMSRGVVVFLLAWFALNLATGLFGFGSDVGDAIAWEAHIGGFAAGFFGIRWFLPGSTHAPST